MPFRWCPFLLIPTNPLRHLPVHGIHLKFQRVLRLVTGFLVQFTDMVVLCQPRERPIILVVLGEFPPLMNDESGKIFLSPQLRRPHPRFSHTWKRNLSVLVPIQERHCPECVSVGERVDFETDAVEPVSGDIIDIVRMYPMSTGQIGQLSNSIWVS